MDDRVRQAIEAAVATGVDYADARLVESEREDLAVRNGVPLLDHAHASGIGVRVLAGGGWGFAATTRLEPERVKRTAERAVAIARASARARVAPARLAPEPPHVDRWSSTVLVDPFSITLEEKLDLLLRIDRVLRARSEIAVAESSLAFHRHHQQFASSEGARIVQTLYRSGGGYSATAVGEGEVQVRSYPNSLGGQNLSMGYEAVASLALLDHAERVRSEAIELLSAPPCPSGTFDLVLGSSQISIQIHESCGHASELDRALGMEESLAGRSFLRLADLGRFVYGSPVVNLVADMTLPGGLATRGYDDDGVRAQRFAVVEEGIFRAFASSRELAHEMGEERSRGCVRADGPSSIPIIRIPNLSLSPGAWRLDDLLQDTGDGIFMDTNRSWSIDQMRLNFEFGCEVAREIRGGKLGRLLRNPTYQGITPEFWGSCDAVCDERHFTLWGLVDCGKGEPMQRGEMSHGAAPARFRRVRVVGA